ncbi:MAG: threonine synthase [Eubacteriales bacterium]|nr:threonine synthase [Eubacteriales bacterium]
MKNQYFKGLKCTHCNKEYGPDADLLLCPECEHLLDPFYDYEALKRDWKKLDIKSRPNDIWRYKELMPVVDFDKIVTLGEGGVPILDCPEIAKELGVKEFYIMCDYMLPSGSLKDRTIAITATKAKEFGYDVLSCDSSGNKAASVATYAARAGIKSVVFVPDTTPAAKVAQSLFHNATLVKVKADLSTLSEMYRSVIRSKKYRWYDCGIDNPYRYEGKKTYAYEIIDRLNGRAPDYILQPASLGMSIVKAWKGFREARELGMYDGEFPKMVCCQSDKVGPIVSAINSGADHVTPSKRVPTVASALAVADPVLNGEETLKAVRESGGTGIHTDDETLLHYWKKLAGIGIFCEPSSAIGVASAYKMAKDGKLRESDVMVAIVTGSGFKDIGRVEENVSMPEKSVEDLNQLYAYIEETDVG